MTKDQTNQPTQTCKHVGDKTNFNPQYCQKCGSEFMYDILTANQSSQAVEQDWREQFKIKESGIVVYPARVVMDFNQVEELVSQVQHKAIQAERSRMVEMVKKMKKKIDIELPDTLHRNKGYNQAVNELLQALKESNV